MSHLLPTFKTKLANTKIKLNHTDLGLKTAPPVILLHGVPENLQCWYGVAPELAKTHRVIAIDWPGFGQSQPFNDSSEYNSQKFSSIVIDLLDTLNIEKAHILATDIGLLPAFLTGLDQPQRVHSICAMDGIPLPTQKYSSWELKSFAKIGSIRGKALVKWFPAISAQVAYFKGFFKKHQIPKEVQDCFAIDGKNKATQEAFLSYFQNFSNGQRYFLSEVKKMRTPIKLLWGREDKFINVALAHLIQKTVPNVELDILKNTGHYIHMEEPKEVAKKARDFFLQQQKNS